MSNGDDDIIIICGGVGDLKRWATLIDGEHEVPIPVYSRAFVNVIYDQHGIPEKKVKRIEKLIDDFRHKFYRLVAQPGEDIHYTKPYRQEGNG